MTQEEMKAWINSASYEALLRRWRFEPSGSPWFKDEMGDYYAKVMKEKREANPDEHIAASKRIGW